MSVAQRHRNMTAVIKEGTISLSNLTGCCHPFHVFSAAQVKIDAQKAFFMKTSIDAAEKRLSFKPVSRGPLTQQHYETL